MSTGKILRLAERHSDLTRKLILEAALDTLERGGLGELTVRAVAKHAQISERTVFRYFADREAFLDAVADAARERMALPGPPRTVQELLGMPRVLYTCFENTRELTVASLHSEVAPRMRGTQARTRWVAVRKIVEELAPRRNERQRRIAAANIRFYLAASTWHYFRFYFGFGLEDTIACAETAIRQSLDALTAR
jgi:AcrR family transcriptional regulator